MSRVRNHHIFAIAVCLKFENTVFKSHLLVLYCKGALNEALSDIFAALVTHFQGASEHDVWLIGENIYTPSEAGDAIRNMCDPADSATFGGGDRDFYPDRYRGPNQSVAVHTNSGIANLGELAFLCNVLLESLI